MSKSIDRLAYRSETAHEHAQGYWSALWPCRRTTPSRALSSHVYPTQCVGPNNNNSLSSWRVEYRRGSPQLKQDNKSRQTTNSESPSALSGSLLRTTRKGLRQIAQARFITKPNLTVSTLSHFSIQCFALFARLPIPRSKNGREITKVPLSSLTIYGRQQSTARKTCNMGHCSKLLRRIPFSSQHH